MLRKGTAVLCLHQPMCGGTWQNAIVNRRTLSIHESMNKFSKIKNYINRARALPTMKLRHFYMKNCVRRARCLRVWKHDSGIRGGKIFRTNTKFPLSSDGGKKYEHHYESIALGSMWKRRNIFYGRFIQTFSKFFTKPSFSSRLSSASWESLSIELFSIALGSFHFWTFPSAKIK